MALRRLLDKLSFRAVSERLDRRKMQQEIDTHKLFLLCTFHQQILQGSQPQSADITEQADQLKYEELAQSVDAHLHSQLIRIGQTVHSALKAADDATSAASLVSEVDVAATARQAALTDSWDAALAAKATAGKRRGRGLAAAVGASPCKAPQRKQQQQSSATDRILGKGQSISMHALAQSVQDRLGFAVHKAPSAVPHEHAGDGLWLSGRAAAGSIVALYPGILYEHQHYRHIPGYPRVDRGNDTLLARYDGAVINALPWAALQEAGYPSAPALSLQSAGLEHAAEQGSNVSSSAPQAPAHPESAAEQQLPLWQTQLELRHPLALAHVANHPPPGAKPNVMVAAYDFAAPADAPAWLRAYIPCIAFQPAEGTQDTAALPSLFARVRQVAGRQDSIAHLAIQDVRSPVKGIALVATRELHNEELLLNYRLSPHVSRPAWYSPVDAEEDQRRWG